MLEPPRERGAFVRDARRGGGGFAHDAQGDGTPKVPRRRLVVEPLRKRDGPGPVRSRGRSTGGGRIVASTRTGRRTVARADRSPDPNRLQRRRDLVRRLRGGVPRAESIARRRARRRAIQRVQTALVRRSFADSSDADAHRSSDGRSSSAEPRDQFERASDVDVAFVLRDAVVVAVVVVVRAGVRRFPVARDAASRASLFDGAFEVRPELRPASSRRDVPTPVRDARDGKSDAPDDDERRRHPRGRDPERDADQFQDERARDAGVRAPVRGEVRGGSRVARVADAAAVAPTKGEFDRALAPHRDERETHRDAPRARRRVESPQFVRAERRARARPDHPQRERPRVHARSRLVRVRRRAGEPREVEERAVAEEGVAKHAEARAIGHAEYIRRARRGRRRAPRRQRDDGENGEKSRFGGGKRRGLRLGGEGGLLGGEGGLRGGEGGLPGGEGGLRGGKGGLPGGEKGLPGGEKGLRTLRTLRPPPNPGVRTLL